jgi:hypothetical protein
LPRPMTNALNHFRTYLLLCGAVLALRPLPGFAQQSSGAAGTSAQATSTPRDGQHDFDFEIGTWKTHVSRRVHPLTGSTTWVEYDGTSVVRKIWDGRANLLELEVDGPAGHIEGLSLRLYNPESRQWSLNFANSAGGELGQPTIGEFKNGRGEFYDQEPFTGRAILVRFVISDITSNSAHFEQAFSDDGGKTWEVNWIATDTRVQYEKGESSGAAGANSAHDASPPSNVGRQSQSDAWWTGPMLAPSAATLPRGHFLIEPYLFDVIAPHSNGFGSLTYINYGLANRFTVGLIPTAGFNDVSDGPSSGIGMGDVSTLAQYRLTQFHAGSWIPTISAVAEETFPTGRYDRLGDRPSNGFGGGAYITTLALYSQTYFWLPNGRILRMRFNLSDALSGKANIEGASVYGTEAGFSGHANPGKSFLVDASWEYSVTKSWVLALDATYRHNGNTVVTGVNTLDTNGMQNPPIRLNSGSSEVFALAPAIEYSWKPNLGVLLGTRLIAGRNAVSTITPAVAINIVR